MTAIRDSARAADAFRRDFPQLSHCGSHADADRAVELAELGPAALPALLTALRDGDDAGRSWLLFALTHVGGEATHALRALARDDDADVRAAALASIARCDPRSRRSVQQFREALRDDAPKVRSAALRALCAVGDEACDAFVRALSDPSGDVRATAADCLAPFPAAASAARDRLLDLLRDGAYGERLDAMTTLASLGGASAAAAPLIADLLAECAEGDGYRRFTAERCVESIERIGCAAVAPLVAVATGDDVHRRRASLFLLLRAPPAVSEELAPLRPLLTRAEGLDRIDIAALLAGAGDADGLAVLLSALRGDGRAERARAAPWASGAGAAALVALDALVDGLRDSSRRMHALSGRAWFAELPVNLAHADGVRSLGALAPERMAPLLEDDEEDVRDAAAAAILRARDAGASR